MLVKDLIIKQLETFGVKHIYNYPGDTTLSFLSSLKNSNIKLFSTKHEGAAGLMASAEAKLTDNISVCLSHSGPGTANILNGIADAASDRVPVLLISGQVETYNIGTNYKQFINQIELTNPLTVYSVILINPETTVDILYKAFTMAIAKGGVSHVIIPIDLWDMESSAVCREYPEHLNIKKIPDTNLINKAADMMKNSKSPVIIYGRGCRGLASELCEIAEKISAPLISTLPAAGIVDYGFPFEMGILGHSGNQYASELLDESDLIIKLAATWWPIDYTPRQANIVQFDTAVENIGASHPVTLGIPGDIKMSLSKLLKLLKDLSKKSNQQWEEKITDIKEKWIAEVNQGYSESKWPLPPSQVIKTFSKLCTENDIISLDSGDNVIFFGKFFGNKCLDVLVSGTWRTMGFSLPAALTAKINNPESNSIAITGDGGLTMVMNELLTARRYNIPITILVLNNGNLAMEKNRMIEAGLAPEEVELTNPDFIMLAESCGIKGIRVDSVKALEKAIKQSRNSNTAILIDIPVDSPIIPGTKLM
ncbi:MAG: thiamine pyrophosphate-binding protein [Halanaerobiales bacterium]